MYGTTITMSKKAQGASVMIIVSVVLMFFAILSMLTYVSQIFGEMGDEAVEEMCRDSIQSRIAFSVKSTNENTFQIGGLSCRTQDLKLTPTAIYQDRWFGKILYDDETRKIKQKESIMEKIAEKMVDCKYMFYDNQHEDLFSSSASEFWEIFGFDENKPKCFICYRFAVKEFSDSIQTEELREYLILNEYEEGVTYMDYFQGGGDLGGPGSVLIARGVEDNGRYNSIENDGLYAIAYFGRNSANGIPIDPGPIAETALKWGSIGLIGGTVTATVFGVACFLSAPVCIPILGGMGATGVVAVGATTAVAASTIEYNAQLRADYLYGADGILESRNYGYYVYDDYETLEAAGCKTR